MTPRIRFNHWLFRLPGMKDAIVLYPYILFRHDIVPDDLCRHELEHFYQVRRDGFLRFYLRWLWFTARYGYWNNPYEIEARNAESISLTPQEILLFEPSTRRI